MKMTESSNDLVMSRQQTITTATTKTEAVRMTPGEHEIEQLNQRLESLVIN